MKTCSFYVHCMYTLFRRLILDIPCIFKYYFRGTKNQCLLKQNKELQGTYDNCLFLPIFFYLKWYWYQRYSYFALCVDRRPIYLTY